jgi:hypothetical protein
MRCVTFLDGAAERLGFLAGEDVLDPLAALPGDDHAAGAAAFRDLPAFIRAGEDARTLAARLLADRELGGTWHPVPGLVAATRYCEPGDQVESEITGIGVLRNPVVAG